MEESTGHYQVHVFVCTNQKVAGECCGAKNAESLRRELKAWIGTQGWKDRVRINASGCLDRCTEGIAVAIYPQNEWLIHAAAEDLDVIKGKITTLLQKVAVETR